MEHESQHREAIGKSLKTCNEVTGMIFDDKIKPMGEIRVEDGVVNIILYHLPGLVSDEAIGDFLTEHIALAVKLCWERRSAAFSRRKR